MEGILNVLKPPGMTSHDVVDFLRKKLTIRKVGHTGTLDPLATGVLVHCVGRATRIAQFLPTNKAYRAELVLGVSTTTGDAQGDVDRVAPVSGLDRERLELVLNELTGPGTQIPPMTSARKVGGKKLYELARKGVEVPREPRPIEIYQMRLVATRFEDSAHPRAIVDVACSKGTYIRTLCAEIGERMGCGAYMSFLVRTAVDRFKISAARTLEEIDTLARSGAFAGALTAIDSALDHLPVVRVRPEAVRAVLSGRILYPPGIVDVTGEVGEFVRLSDATGLLAVARPVDPNVPPEQNVFRPVWVKDSRRS
jgi:tRNA pseudouridine55 synthase